MSNDKTNKRIPKRVPPWQRVLLVTVSCTLLIGGGFAYQTYQRWQAFHAAGALSETRTVDIFPGMDLEAISYLLQAEGIISDAQAFRWITTWQGKATQLRAGHYRFAVAVSAQQVQEALLVGKTHRYRLTIAEGLTSAQILERLNAHSQLSGAEVSALPEATILPETYHFEKATDRSRLLGMMQQAWQDEVGELWATRDDDLPISNLSEAIILASIVEKEAVNVDELATIAGVFHNRLRRKMKLQSDPTVIYALTEGSGKLDRRLLRKDWKYPHPYNTYHINGLPPGPIGHPSAKALRAVLHPEDHAYLFFVADGQGGHRFAQNYAQHQQNVALWRKFLRQKS